MAGPIPIPATDSWPAGNVAVAVVHDGHTSTAGDQDRRFRLASVTKPLFAYAVLVAVEEQSLALDDEWQPGITVRHLLAHASGLKPDAREPITDPARRRIYSNAGYEILGDMLAEATGMTAPEYLRLGVFEPLGMTGSALEGSPAHAATGTAADLARFVSELMQPALISAATLAEATAPAWPDLDGVLPGFGTQKPNPWGLGFEIRGAKSPHWTGAGNSPATFGHFGQTGTFLWVDPEIGAGCVCLTDHDFGPWAAEMWPVFSDEVIGSVKRS